MTVTADPYAEGDAPMTRQPPVQQHADTVTFCGAAGLRLLTHCVRSAIRESMYRGASTDALKRLHAIVVAASVANATSEDALSGPAVSDWEGRDGADWISVAEASAELGVGRRQVQRIARTLHRRNAAKRIGNTWALKQAPVSALARERQSKGLTQ